MPENNIIALSGSDVYYTHEKMDAFRVACGRVFVYIVPWEDEKPGRGILLGEVAEGSVIPSLACEQEHDNLRFALVASDESAKLQLIRGVVTTPLKRKFLNKLGITAFEQDGFEGCLSEYYKRGKVKDDAPVEKDVDTPDKPDMIVLSGSKAHYTNTSKKMDAFRVKSGKVLVYIVPWEKNKAGRRIFLCEVDKGSVIPSFVFKDNDHKSWCFALVAKESEAKLEPLPGKATKVLQQKFLSRSGIKTFEQEGFEGSLSEFYKGEEVKDKALITKVKTAVSNAVREIFGVVGGVFDDGKGAASLSGNDVYRALSFLCGEMGIDLIPDDEVTARCGKDPEIPDIARASHFICRRVVLENEWYKKDCGGFVGTIEKEVVACIPLKYGKYHIFYTSDNRTEELTPEVASTISPQVYSIGRTLPLKSLEKKDIFAFCKKSIKAADIVPVAVLALVTALIGILLPTLNQTIYDDYIPLGNVGHLVQICVVMLSFMIGNMLFSIVKNLFDFRATSRVANDLQNAAYHRLFHLPESFFRNYDSADLANRVASIGTVASSYTNAYVITAISSLFSIVYFIRMWTYSWKLSLIALAMYLIYTLLIVWLTSLSRKGEEEIAKADAEASSKLYQYLNGVDKIRMAGVEERALLTYIKPYARQQTEEIRVNRIISVKEALSGVINSIFSMVLYLVIVKSKIKLSVGSFVALTTAFGSFCSSLQSLVDELLGLYQEKELVKRFWPIFKTVPEDDNDKEILSEMTGQIALEHIKFAYDEGGKNVINDLSLSIKPGEYLGIVGKSGCGKSTLLKILLGFETPQSGMVTVDGKDLKSLDKGAYRRQLGVVLQNGKLISGSIYENITITAPHVKMSRVNEVIDQVGLRKDINQMPMGIHTVLSENSNTISGGQQQRILIARAIVGSPKILIFDEATSALDNLTQAAVSSSLDKMNVTRIVVAHRLSTIKHCDRILVLNEGKIAEEGTYEELIGKEGLFYALASRQIVE